MTHPGLADGPIYLDYNATTPVDPRVVDAALPYLTHHFGNPSSSHTYAAKPRAAITQARRQVADLIGARPTEIIFTGGGSEADTLAIRGAALAARDRGTHVITQATEHPAVLEACRSLTADGFAVTQLPVDHTGRVDPADLEAAITDRTVLVSIMTANSETGTLQPIRELATVAHRHGALLHTDAAQAAGKIPLDVTDLGTDLLTIVGHKMYAPKGIGALYVRDATSIRPIIHGGSQEQGLRAGTENVALIVALGTAAAIATAELAGSASELSAVRDLLHQELDRLLPGASQLNGHPTGRLPNTLNLSLAGIDGKALLAATPQIAASTGSACHEGIDTPSAVLTAMGLDTARTLGAIRLSVGRWTTPDQARHAADVLATSYKAMTPTQPATHEQLP
ncbi:MAG TPA: cysteine desulfurase family protein [Micromonosporaceae bacterium]|nr:cysteine desulfurase family protein [Micromonosporaceae bacterium]